jgi:hypothetical protein
MRTNNISIFLNEHNNEVWSASGEEDLLGKEGNSFHKQRLN